MAAITLLTDFGTADYFVAAMKGVILSRAPGVPMVDITHEIEPQDVETAAFTLRAAYPVFPAGTVHLVVVDPGVGSERRPIVVQAGGHLFVGPDNGVFSRVLDQEARARVWHLTAERHFLRPTSTTFHGRDVFAPVAAALALGAMPEELGRQIEDPIRLEPLRVERDDGGAIRGAVMHVDRFGNCVTNLTRRDLPDGAPAGSFRLRVGGSEIRSLRRFYGEAEPDEIFAIWGSAGFLEVAVNRDSAARRLRVKRGDPVVFHPGWTTSDGAGTLPASARGDGE